MLDLFTGAENESETMGLLRTLVKFNELPELVPVLLSTAVITIWNGLEGFDAVSFLHATNAIPAINMHILFILNISYQWPHRLSMAAQRNAEKKRLPHMDNLF